MSNEVFPLPNRVLWDSGVEIEHNVIVQRNSGGHEQRIALWASPLRGYPLALGEMTDIEWQALLAFIEARGGPWDNFLLNEPISGTQKRVRFAENITGLVWRFYQGAYADDLMILEVRDIGP